MRNLKTSLFVLLVACVICQVCIFCSCSERRQYIKRVDWVKDGEYAIVTYVDERGHNLVYELKCGDTSLVMPFSYYWEDDCDLNTSVNGVVRDWDNPEDEDDDVRNSNSPNASGLIGVGAGYIAGSKLSGKKKKKTVTSKKAVAPKKTVTSKKKTIYKPVKRN